MRTLKDALPEEKRKKVESHARQFRRRKRRLQEDRWETHVTWNDPTDVQYALQSRTRPADGHVTLRVAVKGEDGWSPVFTLAAKNRPETHK